MKRVIRWYIEIWADIIEKWDKDNRNGSYLERRIMLLVCSAHVRSLCIFTTAAFLLNIRWSSNYTLWIIILPGFLIMLLDYYIIFYKKRYRKYLPNRRVQTNGNMFAILFIFIPGLIAVGLVVSLLWRK